MSAPDLTASMMTQFQVSGIDKHLTLLLGAGASATSGLPGWDELAVRLLLRSKSVASREAAQTLVKRQDPMLVAEAARKKPGANWHRSIKAALYEGISELTPSSLHIAAARHLLAGPASETTLVTLNFDTLLELAIQDGTAREVRASVDDPGSDDALVVHHLHGIVDPGEVRGVVLTMSDFNNLVGDPESWQLQLLTRAVRDGALVIAGTSYRDPDVRRWLHVALAGQPSEHAAIVLLARQAFELSRVQFDELQNAIADQWRSVGLEPVLVEDFSDAAQIVRELRHVGDAGYASPQDRARAVWDAHVEHFSELQPKYSTQLEQDAHELRTVLGVDHLNVTLWIADARGGIARWAAQDREYRNPKDLRVVASGHDSP